MTAFSLLGVMYHYVRDAENTPYPQIRALSATRFEQQLDWLGAHYEIVDPRDVELAIAGRRILPPNAAILTFDDGFIDHYDVVLPILQRRRLSGLFFVTGDACARTPRLLGVHKTQFLLAQLGVNRFRDAVMAECRRHPANGQRDLGVFGTDSWEAADERAMKQFLSYELPMDEAEQLLETLFRRHIGDPVEFARGLYLTVPMIAAMANAGMVFGYHTRSHRMLSRLEAASQAVELQDGVSWLRELTRQATVPFCYPWGGEHTYTRETVALIERFGYSLAFNTVRRAAVIGQDHRFELPRLDTRDLPPHTTGEAGSASSLLVGGSA